MSERIRISRVDTSLETWRIARQIFGLNTQSGLVEDIIPIEGTEQFDVQIADGTRTVVIGLLREIEAIAIAE